MSSHQVSFAAPVRHFFGPCSAGRFDASRLAFFSRGLLVNHKGLAPLYSRLFYLLMINTSWSPSLAKLFLQRINKTETQLKDQ